MLVRYMNNQSRPTDRAIYQLVSFCFSFYVSFLKRARLQKKHTTGRQDQQFQLRFNAQIRQVRIPFLPISPPLLPHMFSARPSGAIGCAIAKLLTICCNYISFTSTFSTLYSACGQHKPSHRRRGTPTDRPSFAAYRAVSRNGIFLSKPPCRHLNDAVNKHAIALREHRQLNHRRRVYTNLAAACRRQSTYPSPLFVTPDFGATAHAPAH